MQTQETNIIKGIRNGDESAFEFIYQNYYTALCVLAIRIIKIQEEAEEIVQEIIVNLWNKRESINITKNLKAYLFQSVHNNALNHLKKQNRENNYTISISEHLQEVYANQSEKILVNELETIVKEAIEKLPEQTKSIFKQSRFEGLKYSDIAKNENLTIKGIEFHMSKALQFLKTELKEHLYLIVLFYINMN